MKQHVKNQHYVPQFLLKNFSSKEKKFIWAYDKNEKYSVKNQIKERPIKKVASEKFFYDQIKANKVGSYEYELQKTEDKVAPIIKNILRTEKINDLSETDKKILSFFITLQILRTKGQLLQIESFMQVFSEQVKEKTEIEIDAINSRKIWLSILEASTNFYEIIMNKVWTLTKSDGNFYISDNPVTLQNSMEMSEIRGTLGVDSYGIEIYFPLSPSITLCMFCEKMFQKSGYSEKYIDNLICKPASIENLNSLQIQQSKRFIFSHNNNFELVIKQLGNTLQQNV